MRVLVATASRHGATAEIATRIGATLRDAGVDSDVCDIVEITDLSDYAAVVLGSGVYMGQWLKPARQFVEENAATLTEMPVWLFSSGPVGDPLKPAAADAVDVGSVVAAAGARDHRLFAGLLDKRKLGIGERAMAAVVRAPDGDYRDWKAIDAWAREIAAALGNPSPD